jgi:plasmid stabilization system protein ParE
VVLQVIWSPRSSDDLEAIRDYILRDSVRYSEMVVRDIIALGYSLADFPLSGRFVPEFPRLRLRERQIYSYRLVYRVHRKWLEIVTVFHQARRLFV